MAKAKELRKELEQTLEVSLRSNKDSPVYKAFSIDRIKEGWVFVTITFQNGVITDIAYSEPDMKAIILEKFKIAAAKYWSTIG